MWDFNHSPGARDKKDFSCWDRWEVGEPITLCKCSWGRDSGHLETGPRPFLDVCWLGALTYPDTTWGIIPNSWLQSHASQMDAETVASLCPSLDPLSSPCDFAAAPWKPLNLGWPCLPFQPREYSGSDCDGFQLGGQDDWTTSALCVGVLLSHREHGNSTGER